MRPRLVTVEFLDPVLRVRKGPRETMGIANAIKGERIGKWKIIREETDFPASQAPSLLEPEQVKTNPLTNRDLYGTQPESKRVKKTVIAWVMDNSRKGGAEISAEFTVKVGEDCGFKINKITPTSGATFIQDNVEAADLVILNNIFEFPPKDLRLILQAIFSGKPYVKYEHDHRELDRPDLSEKLFSQSLLNVFLSPFHLENHAKRLTADLAKNSIALPLAIDVDKFNPDPSVERMPNTALISNVRNFKSWNNLRNHILQNQHLTYHLISNNPPEQIRTLATAIRPVPYEQMPSLYSRYEYLVHILDGWGAGERVYFESALCGCKVIANDHVGHFSWRKDLSDGQELREWLRNAPFRFWSEVRSRYNSVP